MTNGRIWNPKMRLYESIDFKEETDMESFCASVSRNSGRLVETKKGLTGRTYNHEDLINGKVRVYTDEGKFLCDPATLKLKGFID